MKDYLSAIRDELVTRSLSVALLIGWEKQMFFPLHAVMDIQETQDSSFPYSSVVLFGLGELQLPNSSM